MASTLASAVFIFHPSFSVVPFGPSFYVLRSNHRGRQNTEYTDTGYHPLQLIPGQCWDTQSARHYLFSILHFLQTQKFLTIRSSSKHFLRPSKILGAALGGPPPFGSYGLDWIDGTPHPDVGKRLPHAHAMHGHPWR